MTVSDWKSNSAIGCSLLSKTLTSLRTFGERPLAEVKRGVASPDVEAMMPKG